MTVRLRGGKSAVLQPSIQKGFCMPPSKIHADYHEFAAVLQAFMEGWNAFNAQKPENMDDHEATLADLDPLPWPAIRKCGAVSGWNIAAIHRRLSCHQELIGPEPLPQQPGLRLV
jgi:hypothetical protein